jgi:hypothetical protein
MKLHTLLSSELHESAGERKFIPNIFMAITLNMRAQVRCVARVGNVYKVLAWNFLRSREKICFQKITEN